MQTPQPLERPERQTWLSLLLGVVVWFLHLNVAYGLASLSCKWGWLSSTAPGFSRLQLVETLLTLLVLPLMVIAIYLPWRDWQRFQAERAAGNGRALRDTEADRRPFVAFVTMLLNCLFLLFVIATFVPVFALNPCS